MNKLIINYNDGIENKVIGEIEVSDLTRSIRVAPCNVLNICSSCKEIAIPRRMKKVWKWWTKWNGIRLESDYTAIAPIALIVGHDWQKIEGSEKEVEA